MSTFEFLEEEVPSVQLGLLFVPYNHHNAFNVKRRSDTVGVAWLVDLWEMAEVRKRALRGREGEVRPTVYAEI